MYLNTVYFQIDENNEVRGILLSNCPICFVTNYTMMGEKVQVRVEVEYLKQYISLCKLLCYEAAAVAGAFR